MFLLFLFSLEKKVLAYLKEAKVLACLLTDSVAYTLASLFARLLTSCWSKAKAEKSNYLIRCYNTHQYRCGEYIYMCVCV